MTVLKVSTKRESGLKVLTLRMTVLKVSAKQKSAPRVLVNKNDRSKASTKRESGLMVLFLRMIALMNTTGERKGLSRIESPLKIFLYLIQKCILIIT
jgi:hypothetical protein